MAEREKERKIREKKAEEERKKRGEARRQRIESQKKSILLVSGYIREFYQIEAFKRTMSFIPVSVTKYIHILYHDPYYHCDQNYQFFGEYTLDIDIDRSRLNIEEQVVLNQFLNRIEDENYIHNNAKFMSHYIKTSNNKSKTGQLQRDEEQEKFAHYDFLRFLWISFVTKTKTESKTVRQLAMKDIWKFTPYNTTRTYFWAQLVFYGLHVDDSFTKLSSTNFNYFLLQNPSLSNNFKGLMQNYYSKKLIKESESDEKQNEMILPDIMSLPSIIGDVEKQKRVSEHVIEFQKAMKSDAVFIKEFEERNFSSWSNHMSFLRVIWCYLNNGAMTEQNIASRWRAFAGDNYHATKTLFWIRIVAFYRGKYREYINNKSKGDNNEDGDENEQMNTWSFDGFICFAQFRKVQIENESLMKLYYSEKVIESDDALKRFIEPDKKSLPK